MRGRIDASRPCCAARKIDEKRICWLSPYHLWGAYLASYGSVLREHCFVQAFTCWTWPLLDFFPFQSRPFQRALYPTWLFLD